MTFIATVCGYIFDAFIALCTGIGFIYILIWAAAELGWVKMIYEVSL